MYLLFYLTEVNKNMMMNYETFKGVVETELLNFLPESMRDGKIEIMKVPKVNREMDAVTVVFGDDREKISPTLYVQDMYARYEACESLPDVMKEFAEAFVNSVEKSQEVFEKIDLPNCKDRIIFQLINAEQNKELLANVPYRPFQDLAIIYRVVVEERDGMLASSIINNNVADALGLKEAELFELAAENTKRINPVKVIGMSEMLRQSFIDSGVDVEDLDMMMPPVPDEEMMYVVTNSRNMNGAISMIYEDELHKLSEKISDDLYILPSSIHEVLAVPASIQKAEELAEMVHTINMAQVNLEDRLSNQVYHYDRKARTLKLATDTPNKRLDGEVAEQPLVYETKNGPKR